MGNGTDVCLSRTVDNPVRWVYTPNPDCYLLKSDSLIVRVDLSTASITYLDKEGDYYCRKIKIYLESVKRE